MSHAALTTANRTLPLRRPNAAYRQREYLTEAEVEKLIDAARQRSRSPERDAAAILLAYRHGLRAAELCALRWSAVDLTHGRVHVNRAKGGAENTFPGKRRGRWLRSPNRSIRSSGGGSVITAGSAVQRCRFAVRSSARCVGLAEPEPLRVRDRARLTSDDRGVPAHGRAERQSRRGAVQRSPAHAAACLRVQACERWP